MTPAGNAEHRTRKALGWAGSWPPSWPPTGSTLPWLYTASIDLADATVGEIKGHGWHGAGFAADIADGPAARGPAGRRRLPRADTRAMDCQLQVITPPVSDVDKAAAFYTEQAGFALDVDYYPAPGFRVVQATRSTRTPDSRLNPYVRKGP